MKREIEFRFYDYNTKYWHYGSFIKHINRQISPIGDELREEDIDYVFLEDDSADWNMPKKIRCLKLTDKELDSVGQYTGVLDSKGRKIFEGDIIECKSWNEFFSDGSGKTPEAFRRKMEVVFKNGAFMMKEDYSKEENAPTCYQLPCHYWNFSNLDGNCIDGEYTIIGNIFEK